METPESPRTLAARDVVRAWELGQGREDAERALCILAVARPGVAWDDLAEMSLGQRDAELLRIRAALFGPALAGYAECPACDERLEYGMDVHTLLADFADHMDSGALALVSGPYAIQFRLPATRDLLALAEAGGIEEARRLLAARCVVAATRGSDSVAAEHLPDDVLAQLAARMSACDPLAEISLDLTCPNCGKGWSLAFDIASFLWQEISAQARRLLGEVHALARAYGWREADILALSAARRQYYLELVGEEH